MSEQKKLIYEEEVNKIIEIFNKWLPPAFGNVKECKKELNDFLSSFAQEVEEGYADSLDSDPPEDPKYDLD